MTVLTKQLLITAENLPLSLWTVLIGCAAGGSPGLNSLYPPGQVARSTLWVIEVSLHIHCLSLDL